MISFFNILKAIILGFLVGFFISIPLGPAGIESVKRTISHGFKEGFKVSLGALTADMSYLLLINCGLSSLLAKNKYTEALFWIISGLILAFIGYKSIESSNSNISFSILSKFSKGDSNKNTISLPFLAGFLITFSNPMTPSLWLFLSGTVIRAWYYVSMACYYTFIFSILGGMITWFALLNYFALKGFRVLNPSASNKTSAMLMIGILVMGIIFVLLGFVKLFI